MKALPLTRAKTPRCVNQCCRFIAQVTPIIVYFHYRKKHFLDQRFRKSIYLILEREALVYMCDNLESVKEQHQGEAGRQSILQERMYLQLISGVDDDDQFKHILYSICLLDCATVLRSEAFFKLE